MRAVHERPFDILQSSDGVGNLGNDLSKSPSPRRDNQRTVRFSENTRPVFASHNAVYSLSRRVTDFRRGRTFRVDLKKDMTAHPYSITLTDGERK